MNIFIDNTILLIFVIILVFSGLSFFVLKKVSKKKLERSLDMVLFLIKLPRYENKDENKKEEVKVIISKMEQFYANFLYLDKTDGFFRRMFYGRPRVVFEIASEIGQGDISFYVAVPSSYEKSLNKYIQGVYAGAIIEKIPSDYTIFEPGGVISASYLLQKNTFFIPLNTYNDLGRDPLEAIANSVSGIEINEGAGIQIVIRPLKFNLRQKGEKLLGKIIDEKRSLYDAVARVSGGFFVKLFKEVGDLFHVKSEKKGEEQDSTERIRVDETTIDMIREKIKKPAFEVNIRLIGVAEEKTRSEEIRRNLEGSFSQFASGLNGFTFIKANGKKSLRQMVYDFSFREFKEEQLIILNSTELTSIFHFPLSQTESPYIRWVKSIEAPPPSELPREGLVFLGNAIYRGEKRPVNIASKDDRRRHFYIIGQTGVGKTTLMREMIRQDIENGEGVGVIDPHGDLIEDTLRNIPKERVNDVVLFEPFDRSRPCGLNMLEWDTPEQRDFAISEMIMIFNQLFDQSIVGPMFEYYMRNAMSALSADKNNQRTLVEIPRMFTDIPFMEDVLSNVSDPITRGFWTREWRQTTGEARSNMLGYVVSKVGRFVSDEMMRNIIGQQKSGFSLSKIMDEKKIFLANLSKGLTGELNSSLLGLVLVSKMQIAALRRARMPESERKDFYLYVDEFQNFTTDSVATILSEARKYKLNLILAHQYMPQLTDEIKDAVIGNVGTMVSFRIGIDDAEFLARQFEPEFSKFDLGNIDNRQYITRMMIDNKITSPFKVATVAPREGNKEMAAKVKELSRLKHGRPKELVEAEIMERARLGG